MRKLLLMSNFRYYFDNNQYVIKFLKSSKHKLYIGVRFDTLKIREFIFINDSHANPYMHVINYIPYQLTHSGLAWIKKMVIYDWTKDRDYKNSLFSIRRYIPFINYFYIKKHFIKNQFTVYILFEQTESMI